MFSKGADINVKDNGGRTALTNASNGHLEVVKYLINKGADINAKLNNGSTALIVATMSGQLEIVKYLISKGANVNAVASPKIEGVEYIFTALDAAETKAIKEVLKNAGAKTAKEIQK